MDSGDWEARHAVASREARRFAYVDEQGWDTSCGYAALATLMRRYRQVPVTEDDLIAHSAGDEAHVDLKVTLASLVRLSQSWGWEPVVGRTDAAGLVDLVAASAPVLVHYDRPQGHFALVLGAWPTAVVTADPARGLELLTWPQFEARWSGVVLALPGPGNDALLAAALREAQNRGRSVERALSKPPFQR